MPSLQAPGCGKRTTGCSTVGQRSVCRGVRVRVWGVRQSSKAVWCWFASSALSHTLLDTY